MSNATRLSVTEEWIASFEKALAELEALLPTWPTAQRRFARAEIAGLRSMCDELAAERDRLRAEADRGA